MRLMRRASSVGSTAAGLGKRVWRTSGSLKRKVSKAFGVQNIQEVKRIDNEQRAEFMASEVADNEASETNFGAVVWDRVQREI